MCVQFSEDSELSHQPGARSVVEVGRVSNCGEETTPQGILTRKNVPMEFSCILPWSVSSCAWLAVIPAVKVMWDSYVRRTSQSVPL